MQRNPDFDVLKKRNTAYTPAITSSPGYRDGKSTEEIAAGLGVFPTISPKAMGMGLIVIVGIAVWYFFLRKKG